LGPLSFHHVVPPGQERPASRRARRCLLKGCEQWFVPPCPQSRYCSGACALAARRWRRVKASRRYRASANGRARRRELNRAYRQRRGPRRAAAAGMPAAASAGVMAVREDQRPALGDEDFCQRMCDRPGCYVLFVVKDEHAGRRFCSVACRLALRRVLDREARYRQRRRRWRREQVTRRCQRPDTS
jgi:hypothetical protein